MKVRMLRDDIGSDDGVSAVTYREGEIYDLGPVLSGLYLREGIAVPADVPAAPTVRAPAAPPSNKAAKLPAKRKAAKKS